MVTKNFLNPLLHWFNGVFEQTPTKLRPYKWWILGSYLLITIFLGYGMVNHLKMDMTLESWFDAKDPAKMALDDFRREFGSDDGLYVVYQPADGDVFSYQSLQLIHELSQDLMDHHRVEGLDENSYLHHIDKITSLTNSRYQQVKGDDLISKKMISQVVPTSKIALENLRAIAVTQRSMVDALFSKDYQYGAFLVKTKFGVIPKLVGLTEQDQEEFNLEEDISFEDSENVEAEKIEFEVTEVAEYVDFMDDFKTVIDQPKYKEHFKFYAVGNPSMMYFAMKSMEQAGVLILIMLAVIIGLLWSLLKSFSAVIWPVVLIVVNTCWILGVTAWLGIEVTTLVSLTAMLMITVGVADSVHVMSTYLLYRRQDMHHAEAITMAYRKTGIPILITSLTTMSGMLALSTSGMPQFIVFGVMSAAGVGMAWFLTWTLLPACLELWHPFKGKSAKTEHEQQSRLSWIVSAGWLQGILNRIPSLVAPRPVQVSLLFIALFALCMYGASLVRVDTNMVELTQEGSELRTAYELVDSKMMGAQNMEIMLDLGGTDSLQDPKVLQAIEKLEQLLTRGYSKYVTKTFSLAQIVKETNQVMHQNDPDYFILPEDRQLTSQLIFLFGNANPEDRRSLVDDNFSKTHVSIMLKNAGSYEYKDLFETLSGEINQIFEPLKESYPELKVVVTGSLAIMMKLSQDMAESQLNSFMFAIVIISIFMILTLGSLQGGLISILPNVIPAIFTFGAMGLMGVPLDGDTMVMAPVIIGLAVDDTIHFITHYRDALMQGKDVSTAVQDTLKEVGQAITFTSLILGLGFAILAFSNYGGLSKMGTFGALGIFVALLCDLFFLPALIFFFKPTMGTQTEQVALQGEQL